MWLTLTAANQCGVGEYLILLLKAVLPHPLIVALTPPLMAALTMPLTAALTPPFP